jgi:hypothetical protein
LPYGGLAGAPPLGLHPLSAIDILDGAFTLLKANARKLLIVVAVFAVPVQLVSAYASRGTNGGQSMLGILNDPSLMRSASQSSGGPSLAATSLLRLLGWMGLALAGGAISRVVGATYFGRDMPASDGLRTAVRRGVPLILAAVLVHILEAAGFLFFLLPGLIVMAVSVAVSPAIAIEELGPMAGIRRSWKLMSPRLWPTIGTLLLTGIVASVLGYSVGLLPLAVLALVGLGHWGWLLLAMGNTLSVFVSWSLAGSVATLFYFDARLRQEGLDLQILAAGLERAEAYR